MCRHVECCDCGVAVYELLGQPLMGDVVEASMFKGINGFSDPQDGDPILCPNCLSRWGVREGLERAVGMSID